MFLDAIRYYTIDMITRLHIENYALIDQLEVDFMQGLSIITGETGAGKSILIGALSLVLGERADASAMKDKSRKCITEATFNIGSYDLAAFFEKNDLDWAEYSILRRELTPTGRSRAFINDTPVALSVIKELGEKLVDIHSQHEKLLLNTSVFQLSIVDAFANTKPILKTYREVLGQKKKADAELTQLLEMEKIGIADLDYWKFQLDELQQAGLDSGSIDGLEKDANMLEHAEKTKASISELITILDSDQNGVLQELSAVRSIVTKLENKHPGILDLSERFDSLYIELKDIYTELATMYDGIQHDPDKLGSINEKLDNFSRLMHKHKADSIADLAILRTSLEEKILSVNSLEKQIKTGQNKKEELHNKLSHLAKEISLKRHGVANGIEKEIISLLEKMGMPYADFVIEINTKDNFDETGTDEVGFMFKANKGAALCPIHKTASGGELSRLMLALKASASKFISLPTVVFDEIDSGISGEIADKVGIIMDQMGLDMQVVTITHLPQIAAKGAHHYLAYKNLDGDKTFSSLKKLNSKSRINEIAKMLSGETLSNAAIDNAKELLQAG